MEMTYVGVEQVLTAKDAAELANNKSDWYNNLEHTINMECTKLRNENKIGELIEYILKSIRIYANEGKYELNIVFDDGTLSKKVTKVLEELGYKVFFIKTMIISNQNTAIYRDYFVNSIRWT